MYKYFYICVCTCACMHVCMLVCVFHCLCVDSLLYGQSFFNNSSRSFTTDFFKEILSYFATFVVPFSLTCSYTLRMLLKPFDGQLFFFTLPLICLFSFSPVGSLLFQLHRTIPLSSYFQGFLSSVFFVGSSSGHDNVLSLSKSHLPPHLASFELTINASVTFLCFQVRIAGPMQSHFYF